MISLTYVIKMKNMIQMVKHLLLKQIMPIDVRGTKINFVIGLLMDCLVGHSYGD